MGRRIDALLKLSGATRKDLAAYLGMSPNNLGHKLGNVRGRAVNLWDALAIAEYFNVSVDVLYGRSDLPRQVTVTSKDICSKILPKPIGSSRLLLTGTR